MKDIILTGPKHSGKTSAGNALALLCSCRFIDLDELITQKTGKSPRQLYCESPASDGSIFRKAESDALMNLFVSSEVPVFNNGTGQVQRVIAGGGGIIDNTEAMNILKKSGAIIVYLNISVNSAWKRIANSQDKELPPFLKTENPQETHRTLHERRASAYLQFADIVIDVEGKSPKEIAAEIFELFKNSGFHLVSC
jgi:shikimate kinase